MEMELSSDARAQQWIDLGLARRTEKGANADLSSISFLDARAESLVHLTGEGARMLDRMAQTHPARP